MTVVMLRYYIWDVAVAATGTDIGLVGADVGLIGVVEAGASELKSIVSIISSSSCVFLDSTS